MFIAQVLVGLSKQLKQINQIEHNIVKNPDWPEANQLAVYKRVVREIIIFNICLVAGSRQYWGDTKSPLGITPLKGHLVYRQYCLLQAPKHILKIIISCLQAWLRIWTQDYRETNPGGDQSTTRTRDNCIASSTCQPLGHAASYQKRAETRTCASRNVENTRLRISLVFSNARVLSQCNTRLRLLNCLLLPLVVFHYFQVSFNFKIILYEAKTTRKLWLSSV